MAHRDLDPETIAGARAGDPRAFQRVVEHFQHRVHAVAFRLTNDRELARDITQDVFLRLYERFDRYDPARPFTPWFLRLATNHALNLRARARVRRTASLSGASDDERGHDPPEPEPLAPLDALVSDERNERLRAAVAELPEAYAAVVVLHYLEGLSVREISERLETPVGTVKVRLYRARDRLRRVLGPAPAEDP